MTKYSSDGTRLDPYKEDSTKGSSVIAPISYKGDMLTQAWVDSRVMATLALWLEKNGYYPRSISDVARRPLEILVDYLVEGKQAEMIDDTRQARELLQARFRVNLNRGGRGKKNVLHNQVLSDKREDLANYLNQSKPTDDSVPSKKQVVPPEILEEAVRRYREIELAETKQKDAKVNGDTLEDKSSLNLTIWEQERKEKEYLDKLNAPLDPEFIKKNIVK